MGCDVLCALCTVTARRDVRERVCSGLVREGHWCRCRCSAERRRVVRLSLLAAVAAVVENSGQQVATADTGGRHRQTK